MRFYGRKGYNKKKRILGRCSRHCLDVVVNKKELIEVACFPASNPFQFSALYFLAGMGLPMLAAFLKEKMKNAIKSHRYKCS